MEVSPAAKVGMITVLAFIVVGLTVAFLGGRRGVEYKGKEYHIIFARVEGVTEGSPVRVAGVEVGKVKELKIKGDRQVEVDVDITKRDAPPLTKESIYTIGQSFVGERWIDIQPMAGEPVPDKGEVNGVPPVTFDELMAKAEGTLNKLDEGMADFKKFVGDPEFQANIKDTVANFNTLSRQFSGTAKDVSKLVNSVRGKLDTLTTNANSLMTNLNRQFDLISTDVRGVTSTMNRIAIRSESQIDATLANVREMTADLRAATKTVRAMADDPRLKGNIQKIVDNLRKTTEDVEGITSDVRIITSDPKVQANIKDTFQQAHDAVKEAREAAAKINKALGRFTGEGKGGPVKLLEPSLESEWNLKNGSQSTNLNVMLNPHGAFIPYGLKTGVDALGNQPLVNFEVMHPTDKFRTRGGVIRSQFGVGIDTFMGQGSEFSLDLYNTHNPQLDFIGRFGSKNTFFEAGVRDSLHDREPVAGFGTRF